MTCEEWRATFKNSVHSTTTTQSATTVKLNAHFVGEDMFGVEAWDFVMNVHARTGSLQGERGD